jgi:hypothetical protein
MLRTRIHACEVEFCMRSCLLFFIKGLNQLRLRLDPALWMMGYWKLPEKGYSALDLHEKNFMNAREPQK